MIAPIPVQDIHAGRDALKRDLSKYLDGQSLFSRGWSQPDDLTLLIPLFAENPNGQSDLYLLKFVFDHYPKGPPSAQFVNALTGEYKFPEDAVWVPRIEGAQSIGMHPNYSEQGQLICSSTTLEFYKVNHDVKEEHIWNEGMSFATTLAVIKGVLVQPYYKGRHN